MRPPAMNQTAGARRCYWKKCILTASMERPQDLLIAHEARSLERSILARIAVLSLMGAFSVLHLLRVLDTGVVAETDAEATTTTVVAIVSLAAALRGLALARRRRELPLVGTGVVLLDILVLSALPVLWLATGTDRDVVPAFLLKNELFAIAVVLVVINALSLQPRYPAFMAAGAVVLHLTLLIYVLRDPRVVTTDSFHAHFTTGAVNLGLVTVRICALVLIGVVLSLVTRNARRLVHDAVGLQAANAQMRERQAQLVMEGRMNAMASLVAGVAHELNSPLGAVSSSLQTAERAAEKLGSDDGDARRDRVLAALSDSTSAGRAAVERLSGLVDSLKGFASLDRADVQRANLDDALDATLAVIDEGLKGGVAIEVEHGGLPELVCRPRELNQVFRTLIVNALEALAGEGTLRIATSATEHDVCIEIADDGPGMSSAQLATLFELSIGDKRERMGMGLGLLTGKRIVERHGGTLHIESRPGHGTAFTITLPRQTALEPDSAVSA